MHILISSRNVLIPTGIQQLLSESPHAVQAHYYQSTEQLISKAILERSELVIMDKGDAETFSFSDIQAVKQRLPRLKVMMISTLEFNGLMKECHTGGVEGYLTYDCSEEEMAEAVDTIERGGRFYCRRILEELIPASKKDESVATIALTPREMEIAGMIANGFTNKMMGERLNISPHTVHTHRKSLMKKLGLSSAREVTLFIFGNKI